MKKPELISKIAEKAKITKVDADAAIKAFAELIADSLRRDVVVRVPGLGIFSKKKRAARNGVNPSNGKKIKISARFVAKFKASKYLKDAVASAKK